MTKRILLVDDDCDQRRILSLLACKESGLSVTALDQFEAQATDWSDYDLAIVDVMMPVISGPQLVREQANKLGQTMPRVILFSALPMEQLRKAAAGLNNVELMTKTGTHAQISTRLQAAAGQYA